jgi:GT2 family glycosyltransferase
VAETLLSILILTHNDGKYVEGCLTSIRERVTCSYEVILVDNGSEENHCSYFAQRYPWVRVIRSEKNLGFNGGNNLAARHATGKHILLLNVDTVLLTDVALAVRLLDSGLGIGVVGAKAYDGSGKPRPSAGRFPRAWWLWLFSALWMKPKTSFGPSEYHAYKVDWVEGSFLMTSKDNWVTIGGFDEKGFLFNNDVDFCQSTLRRKLTSVQCGNVKYTHLCGFGTKRMGNLYAGFRGYHRKFSGPVERMMADAVLRLGLIARILVYGSWYRLTKNARIEEKFRAFAEVYRNWAQITP